MSLLPCLVAALLSSHPDVTVAGEAEEDGYEDEYQLEDLEISAVNYIKAVSLPNFRKAWEDTNPASELSDDYGLGVRDSLQVNFVNHVLCRFLADRLSLYSSPVTLERQQEQ
jgi:hypothetical protein